MIHAMCRWWQEWCHFAGVKAVYDSSQYCVLDLVPCPSPPYQSLVFTPDSAALFGQSDHPDQDRDEECAQDSLGSKHKSSGGIFPARVPLFISDLVARPGTLQNRLIQVRNENLY